MKKKVKRYQEGGETELKKRGLESSKDDKVGFFERLRMGNIDDPRSEAYRRFGAGRAKMDIEAKTQVPEMSSDYSGRGAKSYGDDGMDVPHSSLTAARDEDSTPTRSIADYIRSTPKEDVSSVEVSEEKVKVSKPKPKPKTKSATEVARTMGEGYMKAAQAAAKSEKKESSKPRTSAEIRAGKPAAEETSSGFGPKITYNTPEKLESARKSYYSGFESKPVRTSADIRAGRNMKAGGKVSSASSRADGIAQRGKTRGRIC